MVLIFLSSCSSSKEYPKQPGRCKENCETKWEEANRKCKKKRSIDKELCLKHTYWKLNEWM
tara:strand:+ start:105 stop:287 length:183 start_codon:yes stop_codon:yes gene_type:complete